MVKFNQPKSVIQFMESERRAAVYPHDSDSERDVIGMILLKPELIDDISSKLKPEHFYDESIAKVYRVMLDMRASEKRIDLKTLINSIDKLYSWGEESPSSVWFAEAMRNAPNSMFIVEYAGFIRDAYVQRDMQIASLRISDKINANELEPPQLLEFAQAEVSRVHDSYSCGMESQKSMSDVLLDFTSILDARKNSEGVGIKTGFAELDKFLRIKGGRSMILAARPSMGKSQLAVQIGSSVSKEVPVLYISLEMSSSELGERLAVSYAGVNAEDARTGNLDDIDRKRLLEKFSDISENMNLVIDDSPEKTILDIASACRRMKRSSGLGFVIVDYVQLITPRDDKVVREQQISTISRGIKLLARSLNVDIMLLAQLNRESEKRNDKSPILSDLRESGSLEQDADVVMMLHRPDYYASDSQRNGSNIEDAKLFIRKNRNGKLGVVDLLWKKDTIRFVSKANDLAEQNYNHELAS